MATNEEILAAYQQRTRLEAEHDDLVATIKRAESRLEELKLQLQYARRVDEVVDGVAITTLADTDTLFQQRTLAQGHGIEDRSVYGYQMANGEYWAVRVNAGIGDRQRFYGGHVLGLSEKWTRDDAVQIARRWLKGDESVLS